jgi:hypothetical protein
MYSSIFVRRSSRMTGPRKTLGSAGSPTFTMPPTKSTIFCTSESCASRGTSTRVDIAQPWPEWKNVGPAAWGAIVSRLSVSRKIATDLPPSSRWTRFRVFDAASMMRFPGGDAAGEAHLVDARIRDERLGDGVRLAAHHVHHTGRQIRLGDQLGEEEVHERPLGDGLKTIVQPVASAGPSFSAATNIGKFQVGSGRRRRPAGG